MEKVNLSIIIPVLNEELYLPNLLTCLSAQSFKNFEVLVIDGNSEDNTLKVVHKFNKNLNLKIINAPHRGVSFQRNLGAKNAKSDIFLFLDADVTFQNNFLEKVLEEFNPDKYAIASAKCLPNDKNTIDTILNTLYFIYQNLTKSFAPEIYGWMILVKHNVFDEVRGFNEDMKFSEDSDLVKRIVKRNYKFQLLKTTLLYSSTRRVKKEGRLKYELNMFKYFFYFRIFGSRQAQAKIHYESGKFIGKRV